MHELYCPPATPEVVWSLPALFFGLYVSLVVESWRSRSAFRLVHFITDAQGRGSKFALAYVCILIVGAWAVWALLLRCQLTEWMWTSYLAAFVLGAVAGTGAAVLARVKGVDQPPPTAGDKPKEDA